MPHLRSTLFLAIAILLAGAVTLPEAVGQGGAQSRAVGDTQKTPSSLEVEKELQYYLETCNYRENRARYRNLHLANQDAADRETVSGIVDILRDLQSEMTRLAPRARYIAAPKARYIADTSKNVPLIYIFSNKAPSMRSITFQSADKNSALFALFISTGALTIFDDKPLLKAALAHEFAHHVFHMNPQLARDERFVPSSLAFRNEFNKVQWSAGEVRDATFSENLTLCLRKQAHEHPGVPSDRRSVICIEDANEKQTLQTQGHEPKKKHYREEAEADKLGIWLSKNLDAAKRTLSLTMDAPVPASTGRADDPPDYVEIGTELDPHPSYAVRTAEMQASFMEMSGKGAGSRH